MKNLIASLGIAAGTKWQKHSTTMRCLRNYLFIDDIAVLLPEGAVSSFRGVGPENIKVTAVNSPPELPQYICDLRKSLWKPSSRPNWYIDVKTGEEIYVRQKTFLSEWLPPQTDQGNHLRLKIGITDYLTLRSFQYCEDDIHRDIVAGVCDFVSFPKVICMHMVVVTSDDELVMCHRNRSGAVEFYPQTWSVSLEETVDGEKDKNIDGEIDLFRTVNRALCEELGLPDSVVKHSAVQVVAAGTEVYFAAPIIAVITLPIKAKTAIDYYLGAEDAEHDSIDFVPFTFEGCLPLLRSGHHHGGLLHGSSRFRILAALCNRFGYRQTLDEIEFLLQPLDAGLQSVSKFWRSSVHDDRYDKIIWCWRVYRFDRPMQPTFRVLAVGISG